MDNKEVVSRQEFDNLKEKVDKLEQELENSVEVLNKIDKKVDGILIKLDSAKAMEDLKLSPIDKRVTGIEENIKWLWRTITTTIIGIVINFIWKLPK